MEGSAGQAAPVAPTQAQTSSAQAQARAQQTTEVASQVRAQINGPGRADVPRGEVKSNVGTVPQAQPPKVNGSVRADGKPMQQPQQAQPQSEQPSPEAPLLEWRGKKLTKNQVEAMLGRSIDNSKMLTTMEQKRREIEAKTSNLNNLLNRFKESPDEFFKETGMDEEQARDWLAQTYYNKHLRPKIEQEQLTPEQAQVRQLQRERDEARQALKSREEQEANFIKRQRISEHVAHLEGEAMELAKSENLTEFPGIAYAAAGIMEDYIKDGMNISLADAIAIVKNKVNASTAPYLANSTAEELEGMYGPETLHSLAKKLFAWVKAKRMNGVANPEVVRRPSPQRQYRQEERSDKPLTAADIQRQVDKRLGRL